jgi:ABC-type Mn2+/Zn2+ transport system ATPase subunit
LNDFDKKEDDNMVKKILQNVFDDAFFKDTCIVSIVHHFNKTKELFDQVYLVNKVPGSTVKHEVCLRSSGSTVKHEVCLRSSGSTAGMI